MISSKPGFLLPNLLRIMEEVIVHGIPSITRIIIITTILVEGTLTNLLLTKTTGEGTRAAIREVSGDKLETGVEIALGVIRVNGDNSPTKEGWGA